MPCGTTEKYMCMFQKHNTRRYLHKTGTKSDRYEFVSVSMQFFFPCIFMGMA